MAKGSGGTRTPRAVKKGVYVLNGETYTEGNLYSDDKTKAIKADLKKVLQEAGVKVKITKGVKYDEDAKYDGIKNNGSRNEYNVPAVFLNARGKTVSEDLDIKGTNSDGYYIVNRNKWYHDSDGESWITEETTDMYLSHSKLVSLLKKTTKNRKIGDYIGE